MYYGVYLQCEIFMCNRIIMQEIVLYNHGLIRFVVMLITKLYDTRL